jgi:hypothetical protein
MPLAHTNVVPPEMAVVYSQKFKNARKSVNSTDKFQIA